MPRGGADGRRRMILCGSTGLIAPVLRLPADVREWRRGRHGPQLKTRSIPAAASDSAGVGSRWPPTAGSIGCACVAVQTSRWALARNTQLLSQLLAVCRPHDASDWCLFIASTPV